MILMTDVNGDAVIRTANFGRGKDRVQRKRKKKRSIRKDYDRGITTIKTGQKVVSTGTNISREIRGWWKLINRGKLAAERLKLLKQIKNLNNN